MTIYKGDILDEVSGRRASAQRRETRDRIAGYVGKTLIVLGSLGLLGEGFIALEQKPNHDIYQKWNQQETAAYKHK